MSTSSTSETWVAERFPGRGRHRRGGRRARDRRRDRRLQLYKKLTTNTVVAYFSAGPGAVSRRPGPDHGRQGRHDRQDRARRRQDEGDVPLRQQVQGAGQRHRVDPQPDPGRVARHPVGAALHRRAGAGGQRRHPARAHPGAGRVGRHFANQLDRLLTELGPTPEQPKGPFGDVIESFADGLAGKGEQINKTLNSLSEAVTTLNEGRGDFFGVHQEPGAVRQRAAPRAISSSSR